MDTHAKGNYNINSWSFVLYTSLGMAFYHNFITTSDKYYPLCTKRIYMINVPRFVKKTVLAELKVFCVFY